MFLMSRKIKSLGVKMVLSGEGSDEIFGGYLYFHKAPNKEEFHQETCRKVIMSPLLLYFLFVFFLFNRMALKSCKARCNTGGFCHTTFVLND